MDILYESLLSPVSLTRLFYPSIVLGLPMFGITSDSHTHARMPAYLKRHVFVLMLLRPRATRYPVLSVPAALNYFGVVFVLLSVMFCLLLIVWVGGWMGVWRDGLERRSERTDGLGGVRIYLID
jgi:Na+/H+ antiporter NhaC